MFDECACNEQFLETFNTKKNAEKRTHERNKKGKFNEPSKRVTKKLQIRIFQFGNIKIHVKKPKTLSLRDNMITIREDPSTSSLNARK